MPKTSFTCPKPPSAHIFHRTPWMSSSPVSLPPWSSLAPVWQHSGLVCQQKRAARRKERRWALTAPGQGPPSLPEEKTSRREEEADDDTGPQTKRDILMVGNAKLCPWDPVEIPLRKGEIPPDRCSLAGAEVLEELQHLKTAVLQLLPSAKGYTTLPLVSPTWESNWTNSFLSLLPKCCMKSMGSAGGAAVELHLKLTKASSIQGRLEGPQVTPHQHHPKTPAKP